MSAVYQIRVKGCLDAGWSDWLGEMTVAYDAERNVTTLAGSVVDQSALLGIMLRLHNLNLELLSVTQLSVGS